MFSCLEWTYPVLSEQINYFDLIKRTYPVLSDQMNYFDVIKRTYSDLPMSTFAPKTMWMHFNLSFLPEIFTIFFQA